MTRLFLEKSIFVNLDLFLNQAISLQLEMKDDIEIFAKNLFAAADLNKNEVLEPEQYF